MATLTVDNPFTANLACELPLAEWTDIERVLNAAREGARIAAATPLSERKQLVERATQWIEQNGSQIASDISRMMGKPLAQAEGEIKGMAGRARTVIELADQALAPIDSGGTDGVARSIHKVPLGVVLDLPAWNYPLLTAINVIAPAVLAGNAVIVKHSPRSPLVGKAFADAFRAAGADPRWVQSLDCTHELTEKMVGDERIDHVVFTGSVLGGRRISQAGAGRFLQIGYELGGNDAMYVAPDGDVKRAVESLVDGAMYNAGQSCCAVERVYVHARNYQAFLEQARELASQYVLGDPLQASTSLGPIAQAQHVSELEAMVRDAMRAGAQLVLGGKRTDVEGRGRFFQPTVLGAVPNDAQVMQNEQFGPILAVQSVDSDEQALERMNDSKFGLTAGVWTSDRQRAESFARKLNVGTVFQNRCDHVDPRLPWSGVGLSGRGHSLSVLGFDQLTRTRAWHLRD
ncbi:MAG TPA: aldehyde dehydrogenase family protein [Polyangiales bacterium]|nr:aldehyde dehydrogenase family protein [Polyangiales bacterium]